jgi:hypothetical protein
VETPDFRALQTGRPKDRNGVMAKKGGCYSLIACISGTTPKICIARFML